MEVLIVDKKNITPEIWDAFVEASPQGMIYSCYDYLSMIDKQWQAVLIRKNETIQAVMPFSIKSKAGINYSLQPIFTQYWGIMFRTMKTNISREYELKKQLVKLIIANLPASVKLFNYNFSPAFDYPLPFHWNEYTLFTRYTNQINLERTEEELWANVSERTRSVIRKTEKNGITVAKSGDIDTVVSIFRKAKGESVKNMTGADYEALIKIAKHYALKGMSYNLVATDENGNAIAGAIYFRFRETTIHFFGSTHPDHKSSGAMSLIIWEAIKLARHHSKVFDFEGSMMEQIERFFLGFGSVPVPYLNIVKDKLPFMVRQLRNLKNR